jgi:hypothetical protein
VVKVPVEAPRVRAVPQFPHPGVHVGSLRDDQGGRGAPELPVHGKVRVAQLAVAALGVGGRGAGRVGSPTSPGEC